MSVDQYRRPEHNKCVFVALLCLSKAIAEKLLETFQGHFVAHRNGGGRLPIWALAQNECGGRPGAEARGEREVLEDAGIY